MFGLFIDTSTNVALVGIAKNDKPLCTSILAHENKLSQSLLPSIQSLLDRAGVPLNQIQYVAAGAGPGSYTGTRVGITVAKSLSFALDLPLIGFLSPKAFLPNVFGNFAHVLPSKMQTFYLLKGQKTDKGIFHEPHGKVLPLSELSEVLLDTPCVVTSDRASLEKHFQSQNHHWLEPEPNFDYLTALLWDKYSKKNFENEGKLDVVYFHSLKF
jgi:tRNA threonylcarbamoyl adenosine modification protein YeaZ